MAEEPIFILLPLQMDWFPVAEAAGSGFTVITTEAEPLHPEAVIVSVTV